MTLNRESTIMYFGGWYKREEAEEYLGLHPKLWEKGFRIAKRDGVWIVSKEA